MVQSANFSENDLKMRINLYISCRSLKNKDLMSKSDPQCRLFEKQGDQWKKVAETEVIQNNLNPDFE